MTIPEEIKKQIEDKAKQLYPYVWPKNKKGEEIVQRVGQRPPGIKKAEKIQGVFQSGASFGYSLRTPEVEALKAELERLRTLVEDAYIQGRNDEKSLSETVGWQQFKANNNI